MIIDASSLCKAQKHCDGPRATGASGLPERPGSAPPPVGRTPSATSPAALPLDVVAVATPAPSSCQALPLHAAWRLARCIITTVAPGRPRWLPGLGPAARPPGRAARAGILRAALGPRTRPGHGLRWRRNAPNVHLTQRLRALLTSTGPCGSWPSCCGATGDRLRSCGLRFLLRQHHRSRQP
jgi:hypothetical protein